jgi:hypothetical protein
MTEQALLKQQASALNMHGLLANWPEITDEQLPWLDNG